MSNQNQKQMIRHRLTTDTSPVEVDPTNIEKFAKLSEVSEPVVVTVDETVEEFILRKHNTVVKGDRALEWIVETMNDYVEKMKRGAGSPPEVQGNMVGKLALVYDRSLRDANPVVTFDAVLWYFDKYGSEVFHSEMPYRALNLCRFTTAAHLNFYNHITAFAQAVGNVSTRTEVLRKIDAIGAVKNVPIEYERQRHGLMSFVQFYRG